jgi:peptide/nickel transport system substrate-binding protein
MNGPELPRRRLAGLAILFAGFLAGAARVPATAAPAPTKGAVRMAAAPLAPSEPPSLAPLVEAGKLPPLARRLPEHPLVLSTDPDAVYGGDLRMLVGTQKDTKLAFVYGYARLVRFDADYRIVPDIAERVDVTDGGRTFTFHLRKGHRWSDGTPFTSEDFRYFWEHVANNEDLSGGSPPAILLVDGELPKVTFPDPETVRYHWSKANNLFLNDQAGAYPTILYRPAHYLKQFHKRFTDPEKLKALAKKERRRNWANLHNSRDAMYTMDNPDLPTLQPWRPTTAPPAQVFVAERNPYFHRVDQQGRQLPYIDRLVMVLADRSVIPVKASTGEADLQARYLAFDQITFLKKNAERAGYRVYLWSTASSASVCLYPNLTTNDPVMRQLMRDRRFRQALSLAIDRDEINKILFFGMGIIGQNTVLRSPSTQEDPRMAFARYDPDQANRLLDEMGLEARDAKGFRRRPDGQRLDIIVETSGESTQESDVLELVQDTWARIGIELLVRPSQREVFRRRVTDGEAVMAVSNSDLFGLPTPDMSPSELAPVTGVQLQWSQWGVYFETNGRSGEKPPPAAERLAHLYGRWLRSADRAERARIWGEMLDINAEEVFTIGIIGGTLQPVVVKNGLRGVPEHGIYAWDPGAHFGLYSPDTFYWEHGHR